MVDETFGVQGLDWQVELDILSEATKHRYRLDQSMKLPAWESLEEPTGPLQHDAPSWNPNRTDQCRGRHRFVTRFLDSSKSAFWPQVVMDSELV